MDITFSNKSKDKTIFIHQNDDVMQLLEIDRYVFFGADADIYAIHGPIADISKIFKSCFLVHYQKYCVLCPPFFFKYFKNQDL